jgi:hypothetical protein
MRKIISLYQRNYDGDRLIRDEVVPGAEWVLAGEGVATRKFDGTCCMVRDGKLYKRFDLKPGKVAPADFEVEQHDPVTGKSFGWVPVGDGPEDKWHREAALPDEDGTYELVGPKVQGNPEGYEKHTLVRHGATPSMPPPPLTFIGLRNYFDLIDVEGIVWHHPDGRMAKIKAKDFGLRRGERRYHQG